MATTKYRCTNFIVCGKADAKEEIEIENGEEPICPEKGCGCKLKPVHVPGRHASRWIFAVAAAVLVAISLGLWLAFPSPPKPNPEAAEKMLSDFYPQLPAK